MEHMVVHIGHTKRFKRSAHERNGPSSLRLVDPNLGEPGLTFADPNARAEIDTFSLEISLYQLSEVVLCPFPGEHTLLSKTREKRQGGRHWPAHLEPRVNYLTLRIRSRIIREADRMIDQDTS